MEGRTDVDRLVAALAVSLRLAGRSVLERVDIAVHAGEIVTLVGLNGAGKTSLARVLIGLLRASAGTVRRQPGLRIGYVPQHLAVDAALPLTARRFVTLGGSGGAEEALADAGAGALAERQMSALSGGERHRVMLARACPVARPAGPRRTDGRRRRDQPGRSSTSGCARYATVPAAASFWFRTI